MNNNAYEETLRGVQWVLDSCTSYQVAKDLNISNRTINRYQNDTTPIGNMTMATAEKLYNYYLKERMEMNIESLEKAIAEFNEWDKGARIYLDTSDGMFETSIYHNDVQMAETFSSDEYICVYSKNEIDGDIRIAERRKSYIVDYSRLLLDGWEPMQAQYKLSDEYGNIF